MDPTTQTVTTVAGATGGGFLDGLAATARFNHPSDIEVNNLNTMYVADYLNQRIRQITLAGTVITLVGSRQAGTSDGIGTTADF